MSSQVEFFCSEREEQRVLRYVVGTCDVVPFMIGPTAADRIIRLDIDGAPAWPAPFHLYLWPEQMGSLIWHESRPSLAGFTHASFLKNYFAQESWDKLGLADGDAPLDHDLSPVMVYTRGSMCDGQMGQSCLLPPASNQDRVGSEYAR